MPIINYSAKFPHMGYFFPLSKKKSMKAEVLSHPALSVIIGIYSKQENYRHTIHFIS